MKSDLVLVARSRMSLSARKMYTHCQLLSSEKKQKKEKKNSYNLCGTTTKKKGQGEIRF